MSKFTSSVENLAIENSPPVVSVLMPVFNGGEYLGEAVESILNQTFQNFEFLILDDGSTDDSLKLLRQYATQDPRIRVFARENRGSTYTLNELLLESRGEFVARMDQDDIAMPERFNRQVTFLRENKIVVCVGSAFQMIDSAGRYLATLTPPQTDAEIQQLILGGHGAINHPSAMMRLAFVNLVGGYNCEHDLVDDLDLWLRLGEVGKLANLTDVLLKYRLHDKSMSEKAGQKQREAALRACQSAWSRRNIAGVFSAHGAWRPGSDRSSKHSFMLKYGWWAWNSRQRKTAVYYGWQAIKIKPFSVDAWMLLIVALIKPLAKVGKD